MAVLTDKEDVIREALIYWEWVAYGAFLSSFAYIWDGIYIGATATRSMSKAMIICALLFFGIYWIMIDLMGNHGLWTAITLFMIARGLSLSLLAPSQIFGVSKVDPFG